MNIWCSENEDAVAVRSCLASHLEANVKPTPNWHPGWAADWTPLGYVYPYNSRHAYQQARYCCPNDHYQTGGLLWIDYKTPIIGFHDHTETNAQWLCGVLTEDHCQPRMLKMPKWSVGMRLRDLMCVIRGILLVDDRCWAETILGLRAVAAPEPFATTNIIRWRHKALVNAEYPLTAKLLHEDFEMNVVEVESKYSLLTCTLMVSP